MRVFLIANCYKLVTNYILRFKLLNQSILNNSQVEISALYKYLIHSEKNRKKIRIIEKFKRAKDKDMCDES